MNTRCFIYIICFLLTAAGVTAQVLNAATEKTLTLPDGVRIIVYASADNSRQYYYLPTMLQLSVKDDQPEISLIVYKQRSAAALDGGFLHLLVKWGLSARQEEQAANLVRQKIDTQAVLAGAAEITFDHEERLEIISGNPVAAILRQSLTAPVRLPSMPGQKSAAAFRFSAADARTVWDAVHRPQQLNGIMLRSRFYFTVATEDGYVRKAKTIEGNMQASFRDWIDDLLKYNLLKTQSL